MGDPDSWARRAHREGYRSRSAYKLAQLDGKYDLFDPGDVVVDLGAAPGGWMQVVAEAVGGAGTVIGVDRRSIDPIDDVEAHLETVRGDLTEDGTVETLQARPEGTADVVVSDMAPNMSGEYDLDHARSIHLARTAADVAGGLLGPGGDLVVKVFEGRDLEAFREDLATDFGFVATARPPATRGASSEVYLVARGYLTAPVRPGERLTVDVVDTGEEGDGIARVEGFTLFVEGATAGETVEVEVTDVMPRFGFATPR